MEAFTQPRPSVRTFAATVCIFFAVIVVIIATFFVASDKKASGKIVTETREVDGFTSIEAEDAIDVEVIQGTETSVKVEAEEEIIGSIQVEVSDGNLMVKRNKKRFSFLEVGPTKQMKIVVTVPEVTKVALRGSGDIKSESYVSSKPIELLILGSGSITFEKIEVAELTTNILASGNVELSGKVDKQSLAIDGSGNIDAEGLVGKEVEVSIAGSGDVSVQAQDSLSAKIAGSGSVSYVGDPKALNQEVTGSGEIKKL